VLVAVGSPHTDQIRKLEVQFGHVQVSQTAKEAFRNQGYKPWDARRLPSETEAQDVLDAAVDSLCEACETLLDPAITIQHAFEVLASCTTALTEACLFQEAVVLAEHATCIVRLVMAGTQSLSGRTWLVRWLISLSNVLALVANYERALLVGTEAVDLARTLVKESATLQGELSRALYNLSVQRNHLRQRNGGLCAIEEAVGIDRQLAAQEPGPAHLASLAVSLVHLALMQWLADDLQASLLSTSEAAELFRDLYDRSPDLYCADLAICLTNYSIRQSYTGSPAAALSSSQEAVCLLRSLYGRRPDRFR
jgi:hypothetical protein